MVAVTALPAFLPVDLCAFAALVDLRLEASRQALRTPAPVLKTGPQAVVMLGIEIAPVAAVTNHLRSCPLGWATVGTGTAHHPRAVAVLHSSTAGRSMYVCAAQERL